MNLSSGFIKRPIATILLTIGLALSGAWLPRRCAAPDGRSPRPLGRPGRRLEPLHHGRQRRNAAAERRLGIIAGVNEMTSNSSTGSSNINLQFDVQEHRRRRARGAGRNQRRARRPTVDASVEPHLPQGEPRRAAGDHPGAAVRHAHAGPDLRCGEQHRSRSGWSGHRRGRCEHRRLLAAGGAGRGLALRAQQVRHQPGGPADRHPIGQRQSAQGHGDRRSRPAPDLHLPAA